MEKLTISQFSEPIGASRRVLENWVNRKDQIGLTTRYEETVSGRARRFDRNNVLELALLTALTKAGFSPQHCTPLAADIMSDAFGRLPPKWLVFQAGDISLAVGHDSLDKVPFDELMAARPTASPVFSVVHVSKIFDVVDRLFPVKVEAVSGSGPLRLRRPRRIADEQIRWVGDIDKAMRAAE